MTELELELLNQISVKKPAGIIIIMCHKCNLGKGSEERQMSDLNCTGVSQNVAHNNECMAPCGYEAYTRARGTTYSGSPEDLIYWRGIRAQNISDMDPF